MNHPEPPFYNNLDLTLAQAWQLLEAGVADGNHGFHQPVLATTAADGSADARVAVLRGADAMTRALRFHSDLRTGKVQELRRDARAMVVAYEPQAKVQLRLSGHMEIHHGDATATAAWTAARKYSRMGYRVAQQPGSVLEQPQQANFQPEADLECGAENFCVLRLHLSRLEWLYLSAGGHRRAAFEWRDEVWQGAWLVP